MIAQLSRRLREPEFYRGPNVTSSKRLGKALIYAKTDPFTLLGRISKTYHPNNWELTEMARILNAQGFSVDVLDRNMTPKALRYLDDNYRLFIGFGAGNNGRNYPLIAEHIPSATKVFFAAGPEPNLSNDLIYKRYDYFYERHPKVKVQLRRTIDNPDMEACMKHTDAILCVGNEFSVGTYQKFNKPIYPVYPSSSQAICFERNWEKTRQANHFLYFGGSGNIVKGLDIVLEVFAEMPDAHLYICAPTEEDFNQVYATLLALPNIHFIGFIEPGSKPFHDLTSHCQFVILPSCSEGIATSVTTCMRAGLIPIVTYESGIDVGTFGFLIRSLKINELREFIKEIMARPDLQKRARETYKASARYTQASFSQSFRDAIKKIVKESHQAPLLKSEIEEGVTS